MLWKLPWKIWHVGNISLKINNMDVQAFTLASWHAKRHNMATMPSQLTFHKIPKVSISASSATYIVLQMRHNQSGITIPMPHIL